jgi:hypothetical protein
VSVSLLLGRDSKPPRKNCGGSATAPAAATERQDDMALAQMVIDFKYSNDQAREDMFEEAAERMITAEKAIVYKDQTIAALEAENAELRAIVEAVSGLPTYGSTVIQHIVEDAAAVLAKKA